MCVVNKVIPLTGLHSDIAWQHVAATAIRDIPQTVLAGLVPAGSKVLEEV